MDFTICYFQIIRATYTYSEYRFFFAIKQHTNAQGDNIKEENLFV
jgi:hypothetical protein